MMMRWFLALAALFVMSAPSAALAETGFLDRSIKVDGKDYAYQVYVPRAPIAGARPVILALHGAGERGSDGLFQTEVGLAGAIRRHPERWPAIVVLPQAPLNTLWMGAPAKVAMAALAAAEAEFRTDKDRVYLMGLSMGGNGTWRLAYENPDRFAALVPVCAFAGSVFGLPPVAGPGPDPYAALAARIARTPIWIVHGDADVVVPVDESRKMFAALKAAGDADVTYRELPGVNHNAWDPGFDDEALPKWLFQQRRGATPSR
ncbi:prolyl oligopeptidase family serine peptidase [Phenylobacterium sp.]|uniref:carboxylesterase family protein n=1 Tax=Phenylobacterium sp. TaxID=1871053 RepID=UPI0025E764B6|nr:prolyl oligopeptidase family serine peptidase [Phenylobacterium sp.]MBX3481962.1 prolyl oligopeptidase family serine peptidase [Phenylobacterium sp.]MCW5761594.1 prolyl oligopeptidase family serine peptidase [Phenylobacterium sp.]